MLLIALTTISILSLLLIVIAWLKPRDFRVSRSLRISGTPDQVFPYANDLRRMNAWNPFLKLDPHATVTYEGPPAGVGAVCAWNGNKHVGAGRQVIVESRPHELVRMELEFYRPFPGTNEVEFRFVPIGADTEVTWAMQGQLAFTPRLIGIFISMEKMCGNSFEQGLAEVKSLVESNLPSKK